jgi:hypothetical protein
MQPDEESVSRMKVRPAWIAPLLDLIARALDDETVRGFDLHTAAKVPEARFSPDPEIAWARFSIAIV